MKKLLAVVLATLMCLTVFVGCQKQENVLDNNNDDVNNVESDLTAIKATGKLVVGITYFSPMNYIDDDGNLVGFETEFAKAVANKLGLEAEFVEIDWGTKEIELASKNIDCIWNGMTITPERAETMSISNPYMQNKQVLVAKAENADKYTTAEGLKDATIVAEAESAGEGVANENALFAESNYIAVKDMATALMEVASGTADACIVDFVTSIGMIGEGTDYENLVVVETEEFSPEQYGIAFRKGSDATDAVNAAIAELIVDGTLPTIAANYKLGDLLITK